MTKYKFMKYCQNNPCNNLIFISLKKGAGICYLVLFLSETQEHYFLSLMMEYIYRTRKVYSFIIKPSFRFPNYIDNKVHDFHHHNDLIYKKIYSLFIYTDGSITFAGCDELSLILRTLYTSCSNSLLKPTYFLQNP